MAKVKIVLDSDVIIHFIKAGCFSALFKILPSYEYIILSQVYDELKVHRTNKTSIRYIDTVIFLSLLLFVRRH